MIMHFVQGEPQQHSKRTYGNVRRASCCYGGKHQCNESQSGQHELAGPLGENSG